jgi:CHAT domain-containing protein
MKPVAVPAYIGWGRLAHGIHMTGSSENTVLKSFAKTTTFYHICILQNNHLENSISFVDLSTCKTITDTFDG